MSVADPDPAPIGPRRRTRAAVGLGVVLVSVMGTMTLGAVAKTPCASGDWSDGRQYTLLCYSDIVPLLGTEQLFEQGRQAAVLPGVRGP